MRHEHIRRLLLLLSLLFMHNMCWSGDISNCDTHPCQHGGSCQGNDTIYQCKCAAGYVGDACETDIDECNSAPCQNQASCIDLINDYFCKCKQGYKGLNCESLANACISDPCVNDGTCLDSNESYLCSCKPGYFGDQCEIENFCWSSPCQNNATCINHKDLSYSCLCNEGYIGEHCEEDLFWNISLLQESRTTNHLIGCEEKRNGRAKCRCSDGYNGTHCTSSEDDCAKSPCPPRATCVDSFQKHVCRCEVGKQPDKCTEPCAAGTFGVDCYFKCNCNTGTICDPVTGHCPGGCADGYTGHSCSVKDLKKEQSVADSGTLETRKAAIASGATALVLVVGIVGAVRYKMDKQRKKKAASDEVLILNSVQDDGYIYASTSKPSIGSLASENLCSIEAINDMYHLDQERF